MPTQPGCWDSRKLHRCVVAGHPIRMNVRYCFFVLMLSLPMPAAELTVVPSVDLARYAGKWYEIARLPNRFQRECASDITATYTLRPDGKIAVLNECRTAGGRAKAAKGTARVASGKGPNTKLKVSFFWPFSGNYWIIDLDPDYRWAVVGEPDRKYLWILSREPHMHDAVFRGILDRVKSQGYDLAALISTPQKS
jgi:apolipoprotein D and lipocalin family protein